MINLDKSPNYKKHQHHKMKLIKQPEHSRHVWRLECAECNKKNFIAWLTQQQAVIVDQMIVESQ